MVVSARTDGVVMWNLFLQQGFVQCHITGIEEVIHTTVNGNGLPRLDFVNLAEGCALVPALYIVLLFAKMVFDVPVVGKCSEVNATAQTSASAKDVRMAERVPKRTMTAHAKTCNRSCTRFGNGLIMAVHIADKFLADICLKTDFGIDVAVKVPGRVSVGTYKYDAILIRQLGKSGLCVIAC